ncbi:hypothetical protein Tco_0975604 [Tanacetum coccineum]|uniref:Uncharacterized protein n=1 Tax=Tanacetum coccineum TaxID=301880 RepID=A0ABQ5EF50_9ASTR
MEYLADSYEMSISLFHGHKSQLGQKDMDLPMIRKADDIQQIVQLILFIVDSGCTMLKRCLITADQASVFMSMTFEQSSSSLGHQCLVLHQMTSDHNRSELGIQDHSNEQSSSKLVPKVVPLAVKTATSRQELELLFHLHIAMLRTTGVEELKRNVWIKGLKKEALHTT